MPEWVDWLAYVALGWVSYDIVKWIGNWIIDQIIEMDQIIERKKGD